MSKELIEQLDTIMAAAEKINILTEGKFYGYDNGKTNGKTIEDIIETVIYIREMLDI